MGKTFQVYLNGEDGAERTYSCVHCRAHLAKHEDLISKSFQGSQGRAYLFNQVVNVGCMQAEERILLTGLHFVADIYCACCSTTLGWKYERAFESSQRYKEGKFIIEMAHLIKDNGWDTGEEVVMPRINPLISRVKDISADPESSRSIVTPDLVVPEPSAAPPIRDSPPRRHHSDAEAQAHHPSNQSVRTSAQQYQQPQQGESSRSGQAGARHQPRRHHHHSSRHHHQAQAEPAPRNQPRRHQPRDQPRDDVIPGEILIG